MCPLGSVWVEAGHFSRRHLLSLRHLIGRNTHRDKKWESIPATAARIPIWVISVSCHYIYRSARCSHDFDPILKIPPFMHLVIGPPTHLFIHLITSNICGALALPRYHSERCGWSLEPGVGARPLPRVTYVLVGTSNQINEPDDSWGDRSREEKCQAPG